MLFYLKDILEITNRVSRNESCVVDPQKISDALLRKARDVAEDCRGTSPFQERAIQEGFYYQGGKIDDITILVSVIKYYNNFTTEKQRIRLIGDSRRKEEYLL